VPERILHIDANIGNTFQLLHHLPHFTHDPRIVTRRERAA
jgi:hypothetical protein